MRGVGSSVLVRAPSFWKPWLWRQLEDSTSITSQLLLKRYCIILLLLFFFLYVVVVVVVTIVVVFFVFVVTIVVVVRFCVVVVALLLWLSRLMFLRAAVVVIVVTIVIVVVVVVVRVYIKQGETVLTDSGDVYDITLTGGRLGMIAFGQQDVIWSRLEAKCNDRYC